MSRVLPAFLLVVLLLASLPNRAFSQAWRMHNVSHPFHAQEHAGAAVGDIDGDGDDDFVVSSQTPSGWIAWFETIGQGDSVTRVQHVIAELVDEVPGQPVLADLDGDGDLDVAALSSENTPAWWENPGGEGRWDVHPLPVTGYHLATSDFNGDGRTDLLVRDVGPEYMLHWVQQTDDDSAEWPVHDIGQYGIGPAIAFDANGDGAQDVAIMGADIRRVFLNNDGLGTVWSDPVVINNTGDSVLGDVFVEAGDIDGDGDLDMTSPGAGAIDGGWYENVDGSGMTWLQHQSTDFRVQHARDVDGDGDIDLITRGSTRVYWVENLDGSGDTWETHLIEQANGWEELTPLAFGQLDGESGIDFIAHIRGELTLYEAYGQFVFSWSRQWNYPAIGWPVDPIPIDVDGDGDLDLVGGDYSFDPDVHRLFWWENEDGSGTYQTQYIIHEFSREGNFNIFAEDMDGDGDPDLVYHANYWTGLTSSLHWLKNRESEGLGWELTYIDDWDGVSRSIHPADIMHDGVMDVLCMERDDGTAILSRYTPIGGPSGDWEKVEIFTFPVAELGLPAMTLGDMDDDDDGDLILRIPASNRDPRWPCWLENLDGDFTDWRLRNDPSNPYENIGYMRSIGMIPADLNNDGYTDLVGPWSFITWIGGDIVEGTAVCMRAPGSDDGWEWTELSLSWQAQSVADIDNDGDLDLIKPLTGHSWGWLENDGSGQFGEEHYIHWIIPDRAVPADLNSDGLVDMVGTSWEYGYHWWENGNYVGVQDWGDGSGEDAATPDGFALGLPYPNPFNSMTTVAVRMERTAELTVTVYDLLGREVATLLSGNAAQGTHHFLFDATGLASGTYLVRATVPGEMDDVQKVMLVR